MASTLEVAPAAPAPGLMDKPAYRLLKERFGDRVTHGDDYRGDLTITVARSAWVDAATMLRDHPELQFKLFLSIVAVDYLEHRPESERYEVVLLLYSIPTRHHVRLKVRLSDDDATLPTLCGVYKGANWFEREAWDFFGIKFDGHPNLTRILTHDDFVGHPMRRDYPTAKRHISKGPREWLIPIPEGEEHLVVNIGPSHPAMHGTFRVQAVLDGEVIRECDAEIGYMHRNFAKMAEVRTYWQIIPYTDRLNYCSAFMNGHGWALAVEKLLGIQAPARAEAIRVILSELSRIIDHFICIGTNIVDLGAITPFFYLFKVREEVYDLLEACCGSRLTVSYVRIGGLANDVPDDFAARVTKCVASIREYTNECDRLVTRNPIFAQRFRDVGALGADDALSYGWVGPCLRGSGVAYDIRRDHPYSGYEQYDFDVPVGTVGDCYDRYLVRLEEIKQSLRIVEQALAKLPAGDFIVQDKRVALPPKSKVYSNIESLMNHFKLVYEGILAPPGEVYHFTEAANGELGYFIVSDGRKYPYRVEVRPPSYNIYQAFPQMIKGGLLADAVAIIGGLNIIAGELDR